MSIIEEIDDAIGEYENWTGASADAAWWSADGHHERSPFVQPPTIRITLDTTRLINAMRLFSEQMFAAARRANEVLKPYMRLFANMPTPPPPQEQSGMTARQYRAARRAYARELREWQRSR